MKSSTVASIISSKSSSFIKYATQPSSSSAARAVSVAVSLLRRATRALGDCAYRFGRIVSVDEYRILYLSLAVRRCHRPFGAGTRQRPIAVFPKRADTASSRAESRAPVRDLLVNGIIGHCRIPNGRLEVHR
jgi:hypothetical protein